VTKINEYHMHIRNFKLSTKVYNGCLVHSVLSWCDQACYHWYKQTSM